MARHFCDGFESYPVGSPAGAPWRPVRNDLGKMVVDETKPFGGKRSLHITVPPSRQTLTFLKQEAPAIPVPRNDLHGRVMVFFANQPPRNTHFNIFEVQGTSPVAGNVTMRWGGIGINRSRPLFHFNHTYRSGETGRDSKGLFPGGRWICVQWQFDASDAGGKPKSEARFWVDENAVPEMTVTTAQKWNFGVPWRSIHIGLKYFQPTPDPVEMWIDDFAISDKAIPCPKQP